MPAIFTIGNDSSQGLPLSNTGAPNKYNRYPLVIRRLFKSPSNWDLQGAAWDIANLIMRPRKAYKMFYYRRQTKHSLARDDPSFFIILVGLISLSSLAWSVVYGHGFWDMVKMCANMIIVDFFLFGGLVATIAHYALRVEWAYCFDVHCNSFLVIWVLLYLAQFFLLPVTGRDNFLALFLGNSLYIAAFIQYFVTTYYGYTTITSIQWIVVPIGILVVTFFISLLTQWNIAHFFTNYRLELL